MNKMKIARSYFLTIAATACLAVIHVAHAGTVTYDFNDGTLDGLVVAHAASGYSYDIFGGRLNLSATPGASASQYAGITLETPFAVTGDFTATIEASWQSLSQNALVLGALPTGGGFGEIYFYEGNAIGAGISPPSESTGTANGSTSASFKISRTGDTITTSYNTGSGYQELLSNTSASLTNAAPIFLELNQEVAGPVEAAAGSFDNLTITGASVPEPVSLALFALGGFMLISQRRRVRT